MNWIDVFPLVLLIAYGVGGFFSGVIRRMIGLIALFLGCWAATNMGLQAGGILQQSSNFEVADARIYGFFGILLAVLIIVEVATQLAHSQIQVPALVLNRSIGAALGVLTAIVFSVIAVHELQAAAQPIGGAQLDQLEQQIRDSVKGSVVTVPVVDKIERPILAAFQPFLPTDPQSYFGPGAVNP